MKVETVQNLSDYSTSYLGVDVVTTHHIENAVVANYAIKTALNIADGIISTALEAIEEGADAVDTLCTVFGELGLESAHARMQMMQVERKRENETKERGIEEKEKRLNEMKAMLLRCGVEKLRCEIEKYINGGDGCEQGNQYDNAQCRGAGENCN